LISRPSNVSKGLFRQRSRYARLILSATVFHVPACSPRLPLSENRGGGPGEIQSLRKRAEQLWEARRARDCRAAFLFENPSQLQGMDEEAYVAWCENEDPFRVSEYMVKQVEVNKDDWGWVLVTAKTSYTRIPDAQVAGIETWEKWHRVHDQWYPVPKHAWWTMPEAPAQRNAREEERLRARFEEAWTTLQSKDWHHLYEMVDPRDREDNKEESFVASLGKIQYLSHKVHWVEVIADRGKVHVTYEHKLTDPSLTKLPAQELAVTDHWIARDGQWYRDLKLEQTLPCGGVACDSN